MESFRSFFQGSDSHRGRNRERNVARPRMNAPSKVSKLTIAKVVRDAPGDAHDIASPSVRVCIELFWAFILIHPVGRTTSGRWAPSPGCEDIRRIVLMILVHSSNVSDIGLFCITTDVDLFVQSIHRCQPRMCMTTLYVYIFPEGTSPLPVIHYNSLTTWCLGVSVEQLQMTERR